MSRNKKGVWVWRCFLVNAGLCAFVGLMGAAPLTADAESCWSPCVVREAVFHDEARAAIRIGIDIGSVQKAAPGRQ